MRSQNIAASTEFPSVADTVEPAALEARGITKSFHLGSSGLKSGRTLQAVRGVDLVVPKGKTVGVVGESGCGKSTLARILVGLDQPTTGTLRVLDEDLATASAPRRKDLLRRVQMVFQSPFTSLDPRMTIERSIREPLDVLRGKQTKKQKTARVHELMAQVGLPQEMATRYPAQLSGGQQQRVGLARSLAAGCEVIICDEPVSALDVSIQAQVINLLKDLQNELGVSYVFIAHNLSVVRTISDYVAVMYLGRIVESGPADSVFESPKHPYTKALLAAAPTPDPDIEARDRISLQGDLPSPLDVPTGCAFRTRCWKATEICGEKQPELANDLDPAHQFACFHPE
ncbi:oligopeptide/dipeptide ABC transporter ATP-binding protein [Arthrobacter sp. S39]|uniref:ABC transporter ATP-binding protein n=1 Tax=Arthrobacter sp. S39 TaxID=2509720 RepID=UPI001037B13D|nr:oligopeptide/dipeptide ABC transporter ATP-binding protein [Arthrobacter sp. S39]TAP43197.1 ATP-binding cassette domain-containing protein [Arthrobacter sp. S39]